MIRGASGFLSGLGADGAPLLSPAAGDLQPTAVHNHRRNTDNGSGGCAAGWAACGVGRPMSPVAHKKGGEADPRRVGLPPPQCSREFVCRDKEAVAGLPQLRCVAGERGFVSGEDGAATGEGVSCHWEMSPDKVEIIITIVVSNILSIMWCGECRLTMAACRS